MGSDHRAGGVNPALAFLGRIPGLACVPHPLAGHAGVRSMNMRLTSFGAALLFAACGFACVARTVSSGTQPLVPRPAIVSAQEWGSKPQPIDDSPKHTAKYITIHHAGELWTAKTAPDQFVRNMQAWGQREKHWPDLPYHFLIAPDGRIFEGRPLQYEPQSNTNYSLAGNIGVEMFGNFNEQRPTRQQLESCVKLVAWLAQELKIDNENIRGHQDAAPGR